MSSVGEDGRKSEPSHGNINWCRCCGRDWQFFDRLSSYCDPAVPLIDIYPREIKTCPHNCTQMFTGALVIIAQKWRQLQCLLTDENVVHT